MIKSYARIMPKGMHLCLLYGLLAMPVNVHATTFSTMSSSIFTSNSSEACTQCHHSSLSGVNRHAAPIGADFDSYTEASSRAVTIDDHINTGYMPMDPGAADFTDAADLNPAEKAIAADWLNDGTPFANASASTMTITSQQKTSVTLRGSVDTNTTNATAQAGKDGEWYFEWGPGSTATYSNGQVGNTTRNSTSGTTGTFSLAGLTCGTNYHYRAVAKNGHNTSNGSQQNFSTLSCTNPIIEGGATSVSPPATNEETFTTFSLTRTDDDPGTLTWSVPTGMQGSKGVFTFDTSTIASPVTVRYTPNTDETGSDTDGRIRVTNGTTGLTDTINVNMSITAVNDQPSITSTASTSAIEDLLYSYQVVVNDPDDSFAAGLSISLSNEPGDMAVNSSTGLITWTPVNGDTTSGLVTVTVTDGGENGTVAAVQQFTVGVTGTNDPPVITPGATTTATEDVEYSYQVQVTDIDDVNNGADLGFTFTSQPAGMVVSNTGLITWTPLEGVTSSGVVTIEVEDGNEDVSPPDSESFTITVTQVNDSPVVTPGAPTTASEEDNYNYQIVVNDDDDANDGAELTFTPSNFPTGMAVSNTGLITWLVPRTGVATPYNNITVTVADGGEDGASSSAEVFTLAVSITDADGDLIADYADNCPGVTNAGQEDLDNDTVHILPQTDPDNFPPEGDIDPTARDAANALAESYLKGGDACDEDIDGDGLSNDFENLFAFLDPMNAADAAEDEDDDGVSNLDEFLASTAPDVDSVGPTVNAPADITVDATGLLTVVNIGSATGDDGNEGESTIIKATVNLSPTEKAALDVPVTGCDLIAAYETNIEPFRPGANTVTWATCDSIGNTGRDDQAINVKPLVSVTSGQSIGEGQAVSVNVVLNGDAIAYPATVKYTLTGTALAVDDHDGVDGTVTFNSPGDIGVISFNALDDAVAESDETVIVSLHTPSNMALSNSNIHTVTITEVNIAPQVALAVTQAAVTLGNTVYQPDGNAIVTANANDGNGDALSFDWSASDASLLAAATVSANQIDIDPTALAVGNFYNAKVSVSDGNHSVTAKRLLLVKAAEAIVLGSVDTDGDGVNDDDISEGFADVDADGIPNYLDNVSTPANVIENHTVDLESSILVETDPGLHIALGETAIAAQASGVLIGLQDIIDHGGSGGVAVANADTEHTFLSGLLNFEITGLTDDIESVNVVIPLLSAIQVDTVYRKYNSSGWFDFVVDDLNAVRSAAGDDGSCPQPGSNLYTEGLTVGYLCLQLTIQDGGANDADGVRNYIVIDPGGLALAPEVEEVPDDPAAKANGRVGSVSLWFMLVLFISFVSVRRRLNILAGQHKR